MEPQNGVVLASKWGGVQIVGGARYSGPHHGSSTALSHKVTKLTFIFFRGVGKNHQPDMVFSETRPIAIENSLYFTSEIYMNGNSNGVLQ